MYRSSWRAKVMPEQRSVRKHDRTGDADTKRGAAETEPKISARQKIRNRQLEQSQQSE